MIISKASPILIVDDSGAMRSIVRTLLAQFGYTDIDEASNGAAALTKIDEKHYDLVTLIGIWRR